jgi:hypothetical protein
VDHTGVRLERGRGRAGRQRRVAGDPAGGSAGRGRAGPGRRHGAVDVGRRVHRVDAAGDPAGEPGRAAGVRDER